MGQSIRQYKDNVPLVGKNVKVFFLLKYAIEIKIDIITLEN